MLKKIGQKKDFPENRTTQVIVDDMEICVAHSAGQFTAFEDTCTHAQAALSGCDIENGVVRCPLHGALFSVAHGKALRPPALAPLSMFDVTVDGDDIFINI